MCSLKVDVLKHDHLHVLLKSRCAQGKEERTRMGGRGRGRGGKEDGAAGRKDEEGKWRGGGGEGTRREGGGAAGRDEEGKRMPNHDC